MKRKRSCEETHRNLCLAIVGRILLPVLGIVFGSGVGMLASMLYSFHVTAGIICGAAAG